MVEVVIGRFKVLKIKRRPHAKTKRSWYPPRVIHKKGENFPGRVNYLQGKGQGRGEETGDLPLAIEATSVLSEYRFPKMYNGSERREKEN